LDTKVDVKVDSLHVKRIAIDYLVGYVYTVRVDKTLTIDARHMSFCLSKMQSDVGVGLMTSVASQTPP
jgi:hypothetical protein